MKYFFWIAVVVALAMAGWQVLAPGVTNIVSRTSCAIPRRSWAGGLGGSAEFDEEIRNIVIRKAEKHDIPLDPSR